MLIPPARGRSSDGTAVAIFFVSAALFLRLTCCFSTGSAQSKSYSGENRRTYSAAHSIFLVTQLSDTSDKADFRSVPQSPEVDRTCESASKFKS